MLRTEKKKKKTTPIKKFDNLLKQNLTNKIFLLAKIF